MHTQIIKATQFLSDIVPGIVPTRITDNHENAYLLVVVSKDSIYYANEEDGAEVLMFNHDFKLLSSNIFGENELTQLATSQEQVIYSNEDFDTMRKECQKQAAEDNDNNG